MEGNDIGVRLRHMDNKKFIHLATWMSNSNSAFFHGSSWAEKCLYQNAPCLVTRPLFNHFTFNVYEAGVEARTCLCRENVFSRLC
ncbi:hypothetical protein HBH56_069260 [Parastagonospora nodorum]|nr:hypothetical protein HBH56_069260 [Parastagonospora nodorum]KAH3932492.1 hypothetical protein HBH54_078860 [Parastagonospora nodorum]KAH3954969.1 hypothetical protein HBH53_015500 [Parastagonospora nodorum]KAH3988112.1 hypothetical protein HBH51_002420 [Parastagonospora nodorum]KAH4056175.1 hypothetical protein HBH49_050090 [Parastagonospora nodorum]